MMYCLFLSWTTLIEWLNCCTREFMPGELEGNSNSVILFFITLDQLFIFLYIFCFLCFFFICKPRWHIAPLEYVVIKVPTDYGIYELVLSKGEKERHIYLNAEFQRIARRGKKAFLSDGMQRNRGKQQNRKD